MKTPVELSQAESEAMQERLKELGFNRPPPDADRENAANLLEELKRWVLAENSKARTENIAALLKNIELITSGRIRQSIINDLETRRFDPLNPPPPARNIVTLQGTTIATQGNITVFAGQSKSGKSNGLAAIIAACLAAEPEQCDLLGFRCDNAEGKAVIYLDAEQSKQHFHSLLSGAMQRAGIEPGTPAPPWLHAYNVKGWEPEQINRAVEVLTRKASDAHGGTHVVLIDGYADLVKGPNDEEESNTLIRRLMTLADEAETSIIGVIHYNAGSSYDKIRGHIGSQAERKCEAVVKFEKKNEVITAHTTHTRGAPVYEAAGSRFEYSAELGRFKSLPTLAVVKADKKDAELKQLVIDVFNGESELCYTDLCKRIKEHEGYSERSNSDRKKVSELNKKRFIIKKLSGNYELGNID